jgi:hypothetical protein
VLPSRVAKAVAPDPLPSVLTIVTKGGNV